MIADRQVFVAWCSHVDSQRRKAARYSQALDIYRCRLLTEGATRWLSVSSDLSQLRMKHATQKGVQVSVSNIVISVLFFSPSVHELGKLMRLASGFVICRI